MRAHRPRKLEEVFWEFTFKLKVLTKKNANLSLKFTCDAAYGYNVTTFSTLSSFVICGDLGADCKLSSPDDLPIDLTYDAGK